MTFSSSAVCVCVSACLSDWLYPLSLPLISQVLVQSSTVMQDGFSLPINVLTHALSFPGGPLRYYFPTVHIILTGPVTLNHRRI